MSAPEIWRVTLHASIALGGPVMGSLEGNESTTPDEAKASALAFIEFLSKLSEADWEAIIHRVHTTPCDGRVAVTSTRIA